MKKGITLNDISQTQKERLSLIDFILLFKGVAVRADLVNRFNIAASVATQDFARYKELAPKNIRYDEKRREHFKTDHFKPLFEYDVARTLSTISHGFGDGFLGQHKSPLACEALYRLNTPSLLTVAKITEAIYQKKVIRITYISPISGESKRDIVPHTLVDNGLRWHVRGFDRQKNKEGKAKEFRDFVLTRIKTIQLLDDEIKEEEQIMQDRQWNRFVELTLVPHPNVPHKEAIELDYNMVDHSLNIEIRAALVGYFLRIWNIDCSKNGDLKGDEYHLWLKNSASLYGVAHLELAPGFEHIE